MPCKWQRIEAKTSYFISKVFNKLQADEHHQHTKVQWIESEKT